MLEATTEPVAPAMPAKVFIIHLRVPLFINFLVAKLERSTPPKIDETNAVFVMKDVFLSFFSDR